MTTLGQRATCQQPEDAWQMISIRETTQGTLYAHILQLQERAWVWDGEEEGAHCWHLAIRQAIIIRRKFSGIGR
ncbi:MAG: hypothetical protein U9Q68_07780 [Euryarchaeota archaeon]|nr:hypothetical protein [Euryarchaeota archaeon]